MATEPRTGPVGTRPARRGRAAPRRSLPARPPVVSIVVPTFNEAENIELLLDRLGATLTASAAASNATPDIATPGNATPDIATPGKDDTGHDPADGSGATDAADRPYEIVVVDDDSADGTWRLVEARSRVDPRVRVVRRVGQRGLSSAVLAGMAVARGDVLVVIDADLQHDERRIPELVEAIGGGADVALGSREAEGGTYGPFGRRRLAMSRLGATVARRVIGVDVGDPMSGFFAVSRPRYQELSGRLNPRGFKILLEFLARGPEPRVAEIGYAFGPRIGGRTKFSWSVGLAFALSVIELTIARRRRPHRPAERAVR